MLLRLASLFVCLLGLPLFGATAERAQSGADFSGEAHVGNRVERVAAESVTVEPGMLDTEPAGPVESRDGSEPESSAATAPESVTVESELEQYAELCRRNRGVDCDEEARQMIQGPAPILYPGDPAVFPRPDLHPPPASAPQRRPLQRPRR